ncbi:MAG TPA: hypothetical protein ENH04_00430 [Nitrospirae bacterium]|nr:hypothetical protein [Nitrospirota bacterium]
MLTGLIFAVVLHMRSTAGWRGKKAAVLSICRVHRNVICLYRINLLLMKRGNDGQLSRFCLISKKH